MKKIIILLIATLFISQLFGLTEDTNNPMICVVIEVQNITNGVDIYDFEYELRTGGTGNGALIAGSVKTKSDEVPGCYYQQTPHQTTRGVIHINCANIGVDYNVWATSAGSPTAWPTLYVKYQIENGGDWVEVLPDTYGIDLQDAKNEYVTYDGEGWNTGGVILPVTLSSFAAVLTDGVPHLQWITQSEMNNAGWNIFRSETEEQAQSVKVNNQIIEGAGTTSQPTNYSFLDEYETEEGITYRYWLENIAFSGVTETHGPVSVYIPTEEEGETPEVPLVYGLHQNYPNPFNPDTYISFAINEEGPAKLDIYNIKGQKVINLYDEEKVEKDMNITIYWDGCNHNGKQVSSGVYFYRLETSGKTYNRKMVLTK